VAEALMTMQKLDVAALQRAYAAPGTARKAQA
jgi:hypothetical protein